jgi:hypothetical protein
MACTISGFETHWTIMDTSQTTLERIYDTSKRHPRNVGACVFSLSHAISVNMIAWRFTRACREESTMCWRVGVIGPITKDFVGNLNKIEYMFIVSHSALQHTLLLLKRTWKFCMHVHKFVQYHIQFEIWKRVSWLSVEDEFVQRVLFFLLFVNVPIASGSWIEYDLFVILVWGLCRLSHRP